MHKVIFDTDPGVDDAIALYFALAHPSIEVLGITTTFGNVHVHQAAANALYLTRLAGHRIPVTQGIASPWVQPPGTPPAFIHGDDGLGNLPRRLPCPDALDPRPSAQFIVDTVRAHPHEVSLVAVGPLGNLALALKLAPDIASLVRQVIVMGGAALEPGNVSPVAEANIWNDPHAADIVFGAGWPITMVGLDVTHQVVTELVLFEQLAQLHRHPATDTLLHAVQFYCQFYSGLHKHRFATPGCFAHDLLAFMVLVQPDWFGTESGVVRVVTEGIAKGQTVLRRRDFVDYPQSGWETQRPRTLVCMEVDAQACVDLFVQTLARPWMR
ncbi:nucleoside hydrolase [Curvibacter sp. APW13]|uniref:nucleoside hydrolase n=1 Tax=Curvibacter sp. APW13 TaxID=3077236 RepID=UPI0028DFAEB7|nr:nucleoside hydrolase [Curvibacter sp. APW13]MDT8991654.1 nucleoside hydrolase [Curvibacter sp. APW13]